MREVHKIAGSRWLRFGSLCRKTSGYAPRPVIAARQQCLSYPKLKSLQSYTSWGNVRGYDPLSRVPSHILKVIATHREIVHDCSNIGEKIPCIALQNRIHLRPTV